MLAPLHWRDAIGGGGGRWLDVWSHPIRLQNLDLSRLDHCPRCLRENGAVRAEWSLRHVVACPDHGTRLVRRCPSCGKPTRADDRAETLACHGCGLPFDRMTTVAADPDELGTAETLTSAFRGRPVASSAGLAEAFIALPVGDMAAVVARLARVSALAAGASGPSEPDDGEQAAAGARSAHRLLSEWPDRWVDLLSRLPSSSTGAAFSSPAGRLAARILVGHDGRPIDLLRIPLQGYARDALGLQPAHRAPGRRRRTTGGGHDASGGRPISHAAAMERLEGRADEKLVRWWLDAGLLAERRMDGRSVLALDDVTLLVMRLDHCDDGGFPGAGLRLPRIDRSFTNGREYRKDAFLRDVLDGLIRCRRVGERRGLADLEFCAADVERLRARARLAGWRAADEHVALAKFNAVALPAFGPGAVRPIEHWNALAEAGRVGWRPYDPPTPGARRQKRWSVRDMIAALEDAREG